MPPGFADPTRETTARTAAFAAVAALHPRAAATVTYQSRGCVLVVGDAARVRAVVASLAATLRVVAFVTGPAASAAAPPGITWVVGRVAEVKGYFGRFTARSLGAAGQLLDCGPFSANRDGLFDLVLDLGERPLHEAEVAPIGYYAPGADAAALARVLNELTRCVGEQRKPKYFDYDPQICTHGARNFTGCTRCLAVCPTGAITSRAEQVEIDPYLCTGCGGCASVCPTGAARYAYPGPDELLVRLRVALAAYRTAGGIAPVIVVHDEAGAAIAQDAGDPRYLSFPVPGLGAFGPDAWLAALAYGGHRLVVITGSGTARGTIAALDEEMKLCCAMLAAIGDDPRRITRADCSNARQIEVLLSRDAVLPRTPAWSCAQFAAPEGKRERMLAFLDHLNAQAGRCGNVAGLAAGAPYGAVRVDRDACTVCHACVNLCPTGAFAAGIGAEPELLFTEQHCVQCGLCVAGCPEHALGLVPRIAFGYGERGTARVVARSDMFRCVECGTPFISRALLERGMQHVKDPPLFADGGTELLRLCMTCRQKRMIAT